MNEVKSIRVTFEVPYSDAALSILCKAKGDIAALASEKAEDKAVEATAAAPATETTAAAKKPVKTRKTITTEPVPVEKIKETIEEAAEAMRETLPEQAEETATASAVPTEDEASMRAEARRIIVQRVQEGKQDQLRVLLNEFAGIGKNATKVPAKRLLEFIKKLENM